MSDFIYVCNILEEGRFGGPANRIVQVSDKLKDLKVKTHVVLPKLESEYFEKFLLEKNVLHTVLDITRLSKENKIFYRYFVRFIREIVLLSKFFRKHDFDLIHVNGAYQFKSAIAAKISGTPMVWHINDSGCSNFLIKRLFILIASFSAKGFIVASERSKKYYIDNTRLSKRLRTEIHAPVDVEYFKPVQILSDKSKIIIATVANLNPIKGLEYFIKMASLIASKYKNVEFWLAGSIYSSQEKYSKYLFDIVKQSNLTEENFKYFGHIVDMPSFLSQVDICVFTSIKEASPTTVWESMAMSKPIVTTDVGSVNQYVKNCYSGFVVPVGDVNSLISKVCLLIDDELLRENMGKAARVIAENELDLYSAAKKHVEFYSKVLNVNL